MSLSLTLQYIVIGIVVLISLCVVLKKQAPNLVRRMRIALAVPLLREGRPAWMQRLGRWIAPVPRTGGASSCGGCSGCDSSSSG